MLVVLATSWVGVASLVVIGVLRLVLSALVVILVVEEPVDVRSGPVVLLVIVDVTVSAGVVDVIVDVVVIVGNSVGDAVGIVVGEPVVVFTKTLE